MINVFSLGNPTPPANEGGIDHPHALADVVRTAIQVSGNNLLSFLQLFLKKQDDCGGKDWSGGPPEANTPKVSSALDQAQTGTSGLLFMATAGFLNVS